ncbi:MAG: alanyl-tRNA editing protein, partial [Oscillospiraceae bacterium]|nr:alanyl-tRNA editing protein [Oscillospiraceae bacterium]
AGLRVEKVKEAGEKILHFAAGPLKPGSTVECELDREQRLRRMQSHSGEHVVSGITHSMLGWDNVGFHMGSDYMTIDFSGEVSDAELAEIERRANEIVRANLAFHIWFPDAAELQSLEYRSKLELTENVRIVEIPGVDRCACCAPHVDYTGEIGLIKLLSSERHRGGTRVTLVCGMDAYDAVCTMQRNITAISNLLSAKRHETAAAVERVLAEKEAMRQTADALGDRYAALLEEKVSKLQGNLCIFENGLSDASVRGLLNSLTAEREGICALFSGTDETGYKYIIASSSVDLRKRARDINAGIGGRGGGSTTMIQGSASYPRLQIEEFIQKFE